MVALSILGLNWCQHAGWKVVLREAGRGRRLQVTLSPEEAVVVGHELAQRSSERSGLYLLVGALLREQPHLASINLALTESNRARTALVVRADERETAYPTSAADGIALALRARLPIFADETLLDAFGIDDDSVSVLDADAGPGTSPIPQPFRRALGNQPS